MKLDYRCISNLFLFTTIFFNIYEAEVKARYRGGCTLMNDTIYYVGGLVDDDKGEVISNEVYRINLSNGFDFPLLNWELFTTLNSTDELVDIKVEAYGSTEKLVIFGGGGPKSKSNLNIRVLDTKTKKWSLGSDVLTDMKVGQFENKVLDNFKLVNGSLVNYDKGMLYVGGSIISDVLIEAQNLGLTSYNLYEKKIMFDQGTILPSKAASVVYKNKLFVVGGQLNNSTELKRMDEVLVFDFTTSTWSTKMTSGSPPSPVINADTAIYNGNMYLIGGTTSATLIRYSPTSMSILNLDSMVWSLVHVDHLENNYASCLVYFNQHLIQSFGQVSGEKSALTQFIDVRMNKKVHELPNYILPTEDDLGFKVYKFFQDSLYLVIILSVAIFIGLLIIVICCLIVQRRKKKTKSNAIYEYDDEDLPEPLLETVWSDTSPKLDRNISLNLNSQSNLFTFDNNQVSSYDSNITLARSTENL